MRVVVIYVNPIEYHGPHLPLTTDYEISLGLLARFLQRVRSRNPKIEVVHTLEIHKGCDPAHGPGTQATSLSDLSVEIVQKTDSVVKTHRPDLVLFMTFHGAPRHGAAIEAGVRHATKYGVKAYNPFNVMLALMRDYDPKMTEGAAELIEEVGFRKKFLRDIPKDFHGGLFETSVLLALSPSSVNPSHRELPDCEDRSPNLFWRALIGLARLLGAKRFSRELAMAADTVGWTTLKSYNGYTGAPRLARPAIGNHFIDRIILKEYEENFFKVIDGTSSSPPPLMQWTVKIRS